MQSLQCQTQLAYKCLLLVFQSNESNIVSIFKYESSQQTYLVNDFFMFCLSTKYTLYNIDP